MDGPAVFIKAILGSVPIVFSMRFTSMRNGTFTDETWIVQECWDAFPNGVFRRHPSPSTSPSSQRSFSDST